MKLFFNLNNRWVEPDIDIVSEDGVSLNYVFDSLQNPTDYISTYTTDIQLPKTPKNNKLFDEYYQLDSTIKFQPTEAMEFIFISEGDTITNGTATLVSWNEDYYTFALNGALYTIFSKLLNAGWNTKNTSDGYYLIDEIWKNVKLNSLFGYRSFLMDCNSSLWKFNYDQMMHLSSTDRALNTIGLMPTSNIDLGDFQTDKWLITNPILHTNKILPYGDTSTSTQNNWDVEELQPQQVCEYRVNRMRPYVYVHRLWQIFQNICKEVTGYDMVLDGRWFSDNYEYLKGLVYTLPLLDNTQDSLTNQHVAPLISPFIGSNYSNWTNFSTTIVSQNEVTASEPNMARFEWDIPLTFEALGGFDANNQNNFIFNPDQFIFMEVKIKNSTQTYLTKRYIYVPQPGYKNSRNDNYQWSVSQQQLNVYSQLCDQLVTYRYTTEKNSWQDSSNNWHSRFTFGHITGKEEVTNVQDAHIEYTLSVGHVGQPDSPVKILHHWINIFGNDKSEIVSIGNAFNGNFITEFIVDSTLVYYNGANVDITLEKAFQSVSPFTILLKYSHMLGLVWLVDDFNKRVTVYRRSDYIYDCFHEDMATKSPSIYPYTGYFDMTELTDFSTYNVKPLAWDSRNVLLNFAKGDNEYANTYNERYGMSFGSVLVHTMNKTNEETKELLKGEYAAVNPPIFSAEYIKPISYYQQKKDGKVQDDDYLVDTENTFCFRVANGTYSTSARPDNYKVDSNGNAYVIISQNTQYEDEKLEFAWHSTLQTNDRMCFVRPVFSEVNEQGNCILFGYPYEYYTNDFPAAKSVQFLYDAEWATYFAEIYNPNNKTLTVKAKINGQLFNRLKICPFVTIGNVGYLVAKITDWNEQNDLTTMELRQVTNLSDLWSKSKSRDKIDVIEDVGGADSDIIISDRPTIGGVQM